MSTHASYRHSQLFTMLWLVLLLTALVISLLSLNQRDGGAFAALAFTWGVCAVALAGLGRMTIELRGEALHWSFGYLGWPRWHLALGEIAQIDSGRASAWRGAGIKGLGKDRLFNVSMGGPALRLTLRDGRIVTLGTPEPERLAGLLRARMPAS